MLVFLGWYGRGNCGDEAFKDVHRQLFPEEEKIWADDKTDFSQLPEEAVFILGGGDVVSDFYVSRIPEGRKFFMYGVGLASREQRDYIAGMKERVLGVWVRNQEDADALSALGVPARFTPDIVFQLGTAVKQADTSRLPPAGARKTMLVLPSNNGPEDSIRTQNIGSYHYYEFMMIEMAKSLDYISKYYDVVIAPMSINENDNDIVWALRMYSAMSQKDNVSIVREELSPVEMAALVARSDTVMSMKFHGLVFSMLTGTPFINVGLTRKTQLLCEENGLGHLSIPRLAFSYDRVIDRLKLAEAPETSRQIADRSEQLQRSALEEGQIFAAHVREELGASSPTPDA